MVCLIWCRVAVTSAQCTPPRLHSSPQLVVQELCTQQGDEMALVTPSMSEQDALDLYDNVASSINNSLIALLALPCNGASCPSADVSGCILRFAGHDFMDFLGTHDEQGGSDGCVDLDHPDNAGLLKCFGPGGECGFSIAEHYAPFCGKLSLADFIVISAEVTMQTMSPEDSPASNSNFFKAGFQFGRTTSLQCPESGARMPAADQACGPVEQTFHQRMKLSWRESVALMGVHTLGRVSRKNSKFVGWWSDPSNSRVFNNNYYKSMLSKGWGAFITRDGPWQWIRSDQGSNQFHEDGSVNDDETQVMLDSDLCLAYSVDTSVHEKCCAWSPDVPDGCNSASECCGVQTHPVLQESSTQFRGPRPDINDQCSNHGHSVDDDHNPSVTGTGVYVQEFAQSQSSWIITFLQAWRKATTNGFEPIQFTTTTMTMMTTLQISTATTTQAPVCDANMVWKQCKGCLATCDEPPPVCPRGCSQGCGCPGRKLWSSKLHKCVRKRKCEKLSGNRRLSDFQV